MGKAIAIKVHNLGKVYKIYDQPLDRLKEALNPFKKVYHKEFHALRGVDFEIRKGDAVGIIGRNGSGKSTLLKIITGVLTPSEGRVTVRGKISAILELGGGFNPQLSGMENIYLNGALNGMSREEMEEKIGEIVAFAELGEFIHQPIKTYSSGMRARLAFAVAINIDPDILIVDEALAVGDAAFQRKCFARMEQIRASGATILFVSHSEGSIVSLCNRAIWLSNGEKIVEGEPKLVTGLYMKNADRKFVDNKAMMKEYTELVKNTIEWEKRKKSDKKDKSQHILKEFYNPSLQPKSKITYEEKGARIEDVKIITLDGMKVNNLIQGHEYIFSYRVSLTNPDNKILCAMLIKNKQGVSLGGGHFPARNKFEVINKKEFMLNWRWKCNLVQGKFFINCGVSGENGFLHRIIDSYIFNVIENETDIQSYPMIDFNIKATCE